MVWNPFSSSSGLSLHDALELANEHLENAQKTNNPTKALHFCSNAKDMIKDAERVYSEVDHPGQNVGIAEAYSRHAKLLEDLGYRDKAQRSHRKAEKWGYVHTKSQKSSFSSATDSNNHSIVNTSIISKGALSAASTATNALNIGTIYGTTQDQTHTHNHTPTNTHTHTINTSPLEVKDEYFPKDLKIDHSNQILLFNQYAAPPPISFPFPEPGGRIVSTAQLAYCLSQLHPSLERQGTPEEECVELQAIRDDPNEQQRLQFTASSLVRAFIRDELKKSDVVAEIVYLAPVLEQDDFRELLQSFVNGIEQSVLLKVHLLDGLSDLIGNAPPGYIDSDDLVKILDLLNQRLLGTHQQSTRHTHKLALTVSRVLDSMVDSQVKGLKREELHEPLSGYLNELQESSDPTLVYQAAYAYQALQYIPDDETILQATLRRTGKVINGIFGIVSAVKAFDLNRFINGLENIQGGLEGTGSVLVQIGTAYQISVSGAESGKGLLECLKEGFSFSRKSAWYPALRAMDRLLLECNLSEFELLIREAPCRHDPAFQWGVCQRLGELAANILWDDNTCVCAVSFLRELYNNTSKWKQHPIIKDWILCILAQLAVSTDTVVAGHAKELAIKLELQESSLNDQDRGAGLSKDYLGSYSLAPTLAPQASPLLETIQNMPDVDGILRHLKMERLKDRSRDVYISPRAKVHMTATEDFDLTSKLQEFLSSNRKVFLILGDSGAGKSTFNRALELALWENYDKVDKRIPLFIHLPTIDKPEQDLITKHLRRIDFTEEQIRELKINHSFILICDGYDESQQTRNLYMSNQLNQSGGWSAQMVISCRTEYNGIDYRDRFQPNDRNNSGSSNLFQEAIVAPFNKHQIQDYIEQYVLVSPYHIAWKSNDYLQVLKQIPNLEDLVTNPFLLKLALEVLPRLVRTKDEFSGIRITRVELYDEFLAQWLERSKIRFGAMELSTRDREAFKIISDAGFKQSGIEYLKELATAIYDYQGGNPVVKYSKHKDRKTWKEQFFNNKDESSLLQEAIPLIRNGDQYRFIHKSVLEYGLALAIFDPESVKEEEEEDAESGSTVSSRRSSIGSELSFEVAASRYRADKTLEHGLLNSPLGRQKLVPQLSVLSFLTERVQQHEPFKNQLMAAIEMSKVNKSASIAAANAITILVKAGVQFNSVDLRGVRIPGADLNFGVFDSARLDGADLRKVNLRNTWLRCANFNGALMSSVKFGELPFLQDDGGTICSAYSPDGNYHIVGLKNGDIVLYETTEWKKLRYFVGHSKVVKYICFSPDGSQFASGGDDMSIRLWDVQTGSLVYILGDHTGRITAIAFSPTGDQIASGSRDKMVRLWDTKSGSCIVTLHGHEDRVTKVHYSPDGSKIASTGWDSNIQLWDSKTHASIHVLQGHSSRVNSIAYSPSGEQMASAGVDHTVRIWNGATGEAIRVLEGHSGEVHCVLYSPKGDQIASGSDDETTRLWDTESGCAMFVLRGHSSRITNVAYSLHGDQIASGSRDWTIRVWDSKLGTCIHSLQGHILKVTSLVYSPKGYQIASVGRDKTVRLWDTESAKSSVSAPQGHQDSVSSVAHSPKLSQIASGSRDNTTWLWDVETGAKKHVLRGHSNWVSCANYSPDGKHIVTGSYDFTARIWDVETGNPVCILEGHTMKVSQALFLPKGDKVITSSHDQTARLWDSNTGKNLAIFSGHEGWIVELSYSPLGDRFITAGFDKTVRHWDTETGECLHVLGGHTDLINAVGYSPKGNQIASGSKDLTARLWDTETGDCTHILRGHSSGINCLVYSPSGDRVTTGSFDYSVRLWDTTTGENTISLMEHTLSVNVIMYSPSGKKIATGSKDNSVRVWNAATGECLLFISGFHGGVYGLSWGDLEEQYLVTGGVDKSVRRWKLVKDQDKLKAPLCWSSSHEALTVTDADFSNVQGLSRANWMLLSQRNARGYNPEQFLVTVGAQFSYMSQYQPKQHDLQSIFAVLTVEFHNKGQNCPYNGILSEE
ncbi:hypothetical protein BGZ76_010619 [Entomortierella beljakovae]|nr:hypothetical protein BGZ76_010619 [Entomortierella beljakovae]